MDGLLDQVAALNEASFELQELYDHSNLQVGAQPSCHPLQSTLCLIT